MKVLVTGGCGYVGSVLVPKLLALGHHVDVFDLQWFGNYLLPHRNLTVRKADIRNMNEQLTHDAVIHLAGIANDPDCLLDSKLSWETNVLATMRLAENCSSRFIYASSGSVYGVSDVPEVTEYTAVDPISDYNKTKMIAERVLLSYADEDYCRKMKLAILRPGTVCGFSPRMRLDTTVNMHTMQALKDGLMTIPDPDRMRPHINIEDMTDAYIWMLDHPELVGIYNCGFENMSVMEVAEMIADVIPAKIKIKKTNDPRSYRLNSDKLLATGFQPRHTVGIAIDDMIEKYKSRHLVDKRLWHTLEAMPR